MASRSNGLALIEKNVRLMTPDARRVRLRETRDSGYEHVQLLAVVRDERDYIGWGFATFEEYCERELGYSRGYAYRLIVREEVAAEVAAAVSPIGDKNYLSSQVPESHAREVAKLPKGQRAEAIREAAAKAGGKPTAKAIREVVEERTGEGAVTDGLGNVVKAEQHKAIFAVAAEQRAAANQIMSLARHVERMREANPLIPQSVAANLRDESRALSSSLPYCLTPDWPNVGQRWKEIGVITKDQYERGSKAR